MHTKSSLKNIPTNKYWLLPFLLVMVLLVGFAFSGQIAWMIVFFFFILTVMIVSYLFWLKFLLPKHSFSHLYEISNFLIFHAKNYSKRILSIKNGVIQGDFGLLLKKPKINIINIDQTSVSLVKDASNNLSLLSHGTHIFKKEPEVVACFDLSPHLIKLGPSSPDAMGQISPQENRAEYIARINEVEKTKTRLSSGELIHPFFSIIYRIETTFNEIDDLQAILNISNSLKFGNAFPLCNRHLDLLICNKVKAEWQKYCQEKTKSEISNEFPGLFNPTGFSLKGIALKAYVHHIL